jgi:hypothetical protein
MLCDVTIEALSAIRIVAADNTGVVVAYFTLVFAASSVVHEIVAVVVAGVAVTLEMTGAVVSGTTTTPVTNDPSKLVNSNFHSLSYANE